MKKIFSIGIAMGLFGFDVLSDFVMPLAGKLTNVQGKSID